MQAVDRDFNINRLDRYITICNAGNVKPVILLNKTDLINESELENKINLVRGRHSSICILSISNETKYGYNELDSFFEKGKTYCIIGSSGVGKSTLINKLDEFKYYSTNKKSEST